MKIVVNHLTRMQLGYMCVAGIDLATKLHVRPVLDCQLPIDMLSVHGGPFDIGRIVELGETRFVGKVPEVEDQRFDAAAACHVRDMPSGEFWKLLVSVAHENLASLFGPDLRRIGSTCVISEAAGLRSLGCYWATAGWASLDERGERPRIRFTWREGESEFNVPVTDIRLYQDDHVTPDRAMLDWLENQLAAQPRVLVAVGLSRPYRKRTDDPPRHWLQINNFHFPAKPCWALIKAQTCIETKKNLRSQGLVAF